MKLWGGRFRNEESELMEKFNNSFSFDKELYEEDLKVNLAHVFMQGQCGLLDKEEVKKISIGLMSIQSDIKEGKLKLEGSYEDIHSFLELKLIERIGELGKKLHTARSRNDQVATDMKLYVKKKIKNVARLLNELNEALEKTANNNPIIMPGYTHLQRAQVVTFKYYLMAYYSMFERDKKRLNHALEIMDENPLGCGALAGTTHFINRDITREELGFKRNVVNYIDGVSDRDYLIEVLSDFSIIMMHLSRLSEELIIWSSKEFSFIEIDDLYSTGSSIMPHKKNPDGCELIRGKTGRVYGSLMSMLTVMKALPLAYNKDMQEDKEIFFDSVKTVEMCLTIISGIIETLKVNKNNMEKSVKDGFLNATEVADYLVQKGVLFRDAHSIVGNLIIYCEDNNKYLEELTIDEFCNFCNKFEDDIYEFIDYENILNKGIKIEIKS